MGEGLNIPTYAEGTLSDVIEQRLDAVENLVLFIAEKLAEHATEDTQEAILALTEELEETRLFYAHAVEQMEAGGHAKLIYTDEEGEEIGEFEPGDLWQQMTVEDVLKEIDDE